MRAHMSFKFIHMTETFPTIQFIANERVLTSMKPPVTNKIKLMAEIFSTVRFDAYERLVAGMNSRVIF